MYVKSVFLLWNYNIYCTYILDIYLKNIFVETRALVDGQSRSWANGPVVRCSPIM